MLDWLRSFHRHKVRPCDTAWLMLDCVHGKEYAAVQYFRCWCGYYEMERV